MNKNQSGAGATAAKKEDKVPLTLAGQSALKILEEIKRIQNDTIRRENDREADEAIFGRDYMEEETARDRQFDAKIAAKLTSFLESILKKVFNDEEIRKK